ncbi:sensor histidine kinase [Fulvivirga sp. M361]|uniref:tetratricopeptide repeat-containing sensor histidine kinase n=1 Tax=Fulvivirga sp. M361 TaxID=2594266 RepID=UPI001624A535|nr:sensor histidine kinase [Fulvivirga sp. M361]
MKQLLLIPIFFLSVIINAQDMDLQIKVTTIKSKIEQSEKGERLMWMDSLSLLIEFNDHFNYDSVVRHTIRYALELDSLDIATRNTHDLIYYKKNIIGKVDDALEVFKNYLGKEEHLANNVTKTRLYMYGGDCYIDLGDIDAGFENYEIAKAFAIKSEKESLLGDVNLRIGIAYLETGDFAKASETLQEAITTFIHGKDTSKIIHTKNSLSILYSQNAFYKEAEQERNEAIELEKKRQEQTLLELLYFNAAADYRMIGDNKNWIANMRLALKANETSRYKLQFGPPILCNLIIALAANDSLVQAEHYFKIIESDPETYAQGYTHDLYIETLKQMSLAKGDYQKALQYGKQHLNLKLAEDSFVEIMNAENFMSKVYKALGDNENSYEHKIRYYTIKDSVSSVQKVKALTYYQTLYETEKRDLKIKTQESDIALLAEQDKLKNHWMIFGVIGLVVLFGFILLVRSRSHLKKQKQLQEKLSQGLIQAQEDERTRISRELHDSVGQQLTLIKKKAQNEDQNEFSELTNTALEEVRSISRALYPSSLKQLGLSESIEQLLHELDEQVDMFFSVDIENINDELDEEKTLNFYRFIQESVNNAIKHAKAKTLEVSVSKAKGTIEAFIRDNGCGFENANHLRSNSLGLKTMAERIRMLRGTLSIRSMKGEGTTVIAKIPA